MADSEGVDRELLSRVAARFRERFPGAPPRLAVAPGRVNLIGEHTDYNDGFVLPMAIGRAAALAFRPRSDGVLRAHSMAFDETKERATASLTTPGGSDWFAYVAGVLWAFASEGLPVSGMDVVVDGDVPIGAGLSSSAALEMATARALCAAAGAPWDAARMARLGQRAENGYVGMNCGIMDQFASAACETGHALLLDCRSLATRPVPVPGSAAVVVMDTGARRSLAASAYNDRRAACERVVAELAKTRPQIRALRDVAPDELEAAAPRLDATDLKRARHVVAETLRPEALAVAFASGDLPAAGRLMNDSHRSLRDLYEVSCEELDLVTALARRQPSCYGARMTGAGFGGCAIALVSADDVADFSAEVLHGYEATFDLPAALYPCRPVAGARLVE
jgi:galactokinase